MGPADATWGMQRASCAVLAAHRHVGTLCSTTGNHLLILPTHHHDKVLKEVVRGGGVLQA